jgi:V/A-type H+-transporting ATPase subunit K
MKTFVFFLIITLAISMPLVAHFGFKLRRGTVKSVLGINMFSFFGLLSIFTVMVWIGNTDVFAEGDAVAAITTDGMKFLAAALSTGLACIGSGIAVAAASSAALGAISEDPGIMGKSLIFVALAEGIALYGLLISFMIIG